jgi:DNA polymerase III delta subunit
MDVMDVSALKAQIKSGEFDNFYIFTGPETKVMQIYLEQMAKVFKADIQTLESITVLMSKMHNRSVLQNRSICVLRDSKDFLSNDTLISKITQNNAFKDYIIVLVYTTIDKRSKLYKNLSDKVIEFNYMKPAVLTKYIQNEIDLSDNSCQKLIEVCESDYSRILLEIDKIRTYTTAKFGNNDSSNTSKTSQIDYDSVLRTLINEGTIYSPPRDAVFMFVDAVLNNKPKLAFKLLEESYACGESTLVLLSNLYNSAKQVLQVQSFSGEGKITECTGLTPFQVKLPSGHKNVYSNGDLVYLMRALRNAEKGIKTGEIEDSIAVPYVLVNLWR